MVAARRMGLENAKTRAQLIEAAAQIVRDEGYGAVTARRLAERVGLKRQIVHYYFRTIEDLLVAVACHMSERFLERFREAVDSGEPLKDNLGFTIDATAMTYEFVSLALRHKTIAAEMKCIVEQVRKAETEALARYMKERGIEAQISPLVTTIVMRCVAQSLAVEAAVGVSTGHAEVRAFIEDWLHACTGDGPSPFRHPAGAPRPRGEPRVDGDNARRTGQPHH